MTDIINYQNTPCSICGNVTEVTAFPIFAKATIYLCERCYNAYRYGHQTTTRRAKREEGVSKTAGWKYGLTDSEYKRMYIRQRGLCAVCGQRENIKDRSGKPSDILSVDHNHATGKVRALLCRRCNTALGMLGEDPERCEALAEYIRKHQ